MLANLLAVVIGVSSAYIGTTYDILVQRVVDAWISFPALVITFSLLAVLGPGLLNLILALSLIGAAGASRVIRGATLSVMQNPYIGAARAVGAGHGRILLRYVLTNIMATIIILATIGLGTVILAESALSFLGFGVPPPYPSWGGMLSASERTFMCHAPWMALWPSVAISLAVFGFNMLGGALRDVLDPRLRGVKRGCAGDARTRPVQQPQNLTGPQSPRKRIHRCRAEPRSRRAWPSDSSWRTPAAVEAGTMYPRPS